MYLRNNASGFDPIPSTVPTMISAYSNCKASYSKTTWKTRVGHVDQTWLMPAQGEATQAQGHANNAQKARLAQFVDVSTMLKYHWTTIHQHFMKWCIHTGAQIQRWTTQCNCKQLQDVDVDGHLCTSRIQFGTVVAATNPRWLSSRQGLGQNN